MTLTIQYTGQLATEAGKSEETIDFPAGTLLAELVSELVDRHGRGYSKLLLNQEGKLRASLMVILDGEQAVGRLETMSLDGVKVLMLMTPIAGG